MNLTQHKNKRGGSVIEKLFSTAMIGFIFSNLVTAIGPTVDGIIVGMYYDVESVAAIGLTSFLLVGYRTIAASIISKGSHVIGSRLMGSGDKEGANQVFSLSIVLSGFVSVFLAAVSIGFSRYIAVFLGARGVSSHLLGPTSDYLIGYCVGLPFYTATVILTPYLQMDGDYNRVTAASIAMTVVDILADLYVVKVLHGGLLQIGLATSVGHLVSFLIIVSHFAFRKSGFRFSMKGIRFSQSLDILQSGAATGIVKLSNTFCGILINNMLAVFVTSGAIAVFSVGNSIVKTCFSFWLGSANTLMSFTSMFFGEEDRSALRAVQRIAVEKGLRLTCAVTAAVFVFAEPLASIYLRNADAATLGMARESIRLFALSMPFNVLIYCFQLYLIGAGRRAFANIYSVLLDFAIPVPVTLLMLLMTGYHGAWLAKPIINLLAVLVAWIYIRRQPGENLAEKALLLPEGFGVASGHELCFAVDSMEDIIGISRVTIAFAMENGADKKQANLYSLAVEELAGNIVEHGFSDGQPHHMDLRMLVKDDQLILRFRDDCRHFDPVEKYRTELQFADDPERGVAIRMMMRLAKEIKYTGLYGMNNLIIRI